MLAERKKYVNGAGRLQITKDHDEDCVEGHTFFQKPHHTHGEQTISHYNIQNVTIMLKISTLDNGTMLDQARTCLNGLLNHQINNIA